MDMRKQLEISERLYVFVGMRDAEAIKTDLPLRCSKPNGLFSRNVVVGFGNSTNDFYEKRCGSAVSLIGR